MKIKILKHGLNLSEDWEFRGVYVKGKKEVYTSDDYRFLVKRTSHDGSVLEDELVLLYFHQRVGLEIFGKTLDVIGLYGGLKIVGSHFRYKNYNYYYLNNDKALLSAAFNDWKLSDPLLSDGKKHKHFLDLGGFGGLKQNLSKIKGYSGSYEFDGIVY